LSATVAPLNVTDNSSAGINIRMGSSGTSRAAVDIGFAQVSGNGSGLSAGVGSGGGESDLSVSNSTFTGNSSGGVGISGTTSAPNATVDVRLTALTVSGNSNGPSLTLLAGGGITLDLFAGIDGPDTSVTGGTVRAALTASTVAENSARLSGGGIRAREEVRRAVPGQLRVENASATLTVTNCTLFANHSDSFGGGLSNTAVGTDGPVGLTLVSDTIAFNDATNQGGGVSGNGVMVRSTIVADNTAGTAADVSGDFTSLGHNLIGQTDGSTGFDGGDLTGTADNPLDPLFGDFGNFGGPTQTLSLLSGSPAIGNGDPAGTATDQRGRPRSTTAPSIGAFEFTG
jgi:hypothetical protein